MTVILLSVGVGLVGLLGWVTMTFNRLVQARNKQRESWSGVDVQLKKRADLVPSLVECVSGYRDHEATLQKEVATARASGDAVGTLRALVAVAENYPDLKASTNFQNLMSQLVAIEDDLQFARRYFNGAIRDFRNLAESFPSCLIAGAFGFVPGEFFEVETVTERSNPEVKL